MVPIEVSSEDSSQSQMEYYDGSSDTTGTNNNNNNPKEKKLAKAETRAVLRLRALVILALLVASGAVSFIVYRITQRGEYNQYRNLYDGASDKILETFGMILSDKMGAIASVAVAAIAHGVDHQRDWPFVTLSSFQERCATARAQSGALFVEFAPFVENRNFWEWMDYSNTDEDEWMASAVEYQHQFLANHTTLRAIVPDTITDVNPGYIHHVDAFGNRVRDIGPGPFMPIWQTSPLLTSRLINTNILREPGTREDAWRCFQMGGMVVGGAMASGQRHTVSNTKFRSHMESFQAGAIVRDQDDPVIQFFLPIFDSFEATRKPVAVMIAYVEIISYFENLLPSSSAQITVVLDDSCGDIFTFAINGETAEIIGHGDHHETQYDDQKRTVKLSDTTYISDGTEFGLPIDHGNCTWSLSTYPSTEYYRTHNTNMPVLITIAVATIFLFTAAMFFVYDRLVARRQKIILQSATKSSAIVASLFPKKIRDQLMAEENDANDDDEYMAPGRRLKSYLGGSDDQDLGQKPIAEVFPHATVMFCDIAGFTAWSSSRDPTSVFVLLQSVYQAFDEIAKKRRVFKAHDIIAGDSYLAVTGLPEPQPRHAIIMAKFASDCMACLARVTKDLETELGPGTTDLTMRFGLHSGPVTAGVLRGEKSRFQLFGDTVNTAARMESTGKRSMIQGSETTANLLIQQGKGHWVTPREDVVNVKGKGVLKTFWIQPGTTGSASSLDETRSNQTDSSDQVQEVRRVHCSQRYERLIDWVVELMKQYLKRIVARRQAIGEEKVFAPLSGEIIAKRASALDEVREAINLPDFDPVVVTRQEAILADLELDDIVCSQLYQFVVRIASLYPPNHFHNFEHACHVTLSVHKLLQRIAKPNIDESMGAANAASHIHNYTDGLTSDPLALFGIVFSALIHDVDHRGVSNVQLAKEDNEMAALFENKSIAEQQSLKVSWDLLMSSEFVDLRNSIVGHGSELKRFRQILVNVVLATDIMDKELNQLRNDRWQKAFSSSTVKTGREKQQRATIFIEHIIQASDVSHTMQHWHIYQKWNTALFHEMSEAFAKGRMGVDPATFWYEGELKFFDNYIIPLAKKLKECDVFGVSSDECFNYATRNRAEWEERGKSIVEHLVRNRKRVRKSIEK